MKSKTNYWKWAFLLLLAFIILCIGYIFLRSRPVDTIATAPTVQTSSQTDDSVLLSTSMEKEEAEQVLNIVLHSSISEDYYFNVNDQLEFHGAITFLGLDIPFSLSLTPKALPNGNIQLYGESVEIATINLPVSTVMSLLSSQLDLPDYVGIDSEAQTIVIDLQQLTDDYRIDIQVTQINLQAPNNQITLDLYVAEDLITEYIENYDY